MARSTNPRAAKAADAETTASSFDALMADLENDEDEAAEEGTAEVNLDPDGNPPSTETPTGSVEAGSTDTAALEKAFEATVPASTEPAPTEPVAAKSRKKKADADDDLSHLPKSTRAEIEAGRNALKKFAASRAAE